MPQNKSAEKRVRQSESRNERNREQKREMKILVKGLKKLVDDKSGKEQIDLALRKSAQKLDRLAVKGVIHRNNAANKKSKLAKLVNKANVSV